MKLMPPKDLGFQESKVSKSQKLSMQSLSLSLLGDNLGVSDAH